MMKYAPFSEYKMLNLKERTPECKRAYIEGYKAACEYIMKQVDSAVFLMDGVYETLLIEDETDDAE